MQPLYRKEKLPRYTGQEKIGELRKLVNETTKVGTSSKIAKKNPKIKICLRQKFHLTCRIRLRSLGRSQIRTENHI